MKKISTLVVTALFIFIVMFFCACGNNANNTEGMPMNETFFNPIRIERNMGDPWLYQHEGYYYYMQSGGTGIKLTKSKWMTQVALNDADESITKVIFRQKSIDVVEIWAPEIFFFDGYWYVYFTATTDDADTLTKDGNRRIYGMKSKTSNAFGEWETAVKIDLPADCRAIDATFMDYAGKQYIIWSGWPSKANQGYTQNLYITQLEIGNPLKAVSLKDSARILISQPTHEWETKGAVQNEGPAVCFAPDGTPTVLFSASYSGGDGYCIGYLSLSGNPLVGKNWTKSDTPLMQTDMTDSEVIAPGHCSVTKSPDGTEDWICYHSAKYSGSGWDRMARLQKMEWKDNKPYVEEISRFSSAINLPSGEKVNRRLFEAESAECENCTVIDIEESRASGNQAVSVEENGSITFTVKAPQNGVYLLSVRFSNREAIEQTITVEINGEKYELYAPKTQYDDLFILTNVYCTLYVKNGDNTVKISSEKSILIDCIIVDYLDMA